MKAGHLRTWPHQAGTVERLEVDLSAVEMTDRRPVAIRMKVGPVDGTLPARCNYPSWVPKRRKWETKLNLQDIPPTPLSDTSDLLEQIREGWQLVVGRG
jgi:hypothetical protein